MAFARVSPALVSSRTASIFIGERSPGSAPRASPATSIAHAPRTTAAATPMQNVRNSVARKSTTIGRTLDLLLEASIFDLLCAGPLRALPGIEAPEKGLRRAKKMESCRRIVAGRWQCPELRPSGEGMRYIQRGFVSPPFLRRGGAKRRGGFAGVVLAP